MQEGARSNGTWWNQDGTLYRRWHKNYMFVSSACRRSLVSLLYNWYYDVQYSASNAACLSLSALSVGCFCAIYGIKMVTQTLKMSKVVPWQRSPVIVQSSYFEFEFCWWSGCWSSRIAIILYGKSHVDNGSGVSLHVQLDRSHLHLSTLLANLISHHEDCRSYRSCWLCRCFRPWCPPEGEFGEHVLSIRFC